MFEYAPQLARLVPHLRWFQNIGELKLTNHWIEVVIMSIALC